MHNQQVRTLGDILRQNVREHPDRVALVFEGERHTYSKIASRASQVAAALLGAGVSPGERTLLCLPNCPELVTTLFGAIEAGSVFSILDSSIPYDKLRQVAVNCQPTAFVISNRHATFVSRLLEDVTSLRVVIVVGATDPLPSLTGKTILNFESIEHSAHSSHNIVSASPSDLAYLIYTSGSTGEPKGVMVTHASSLFAIRIDVEYLSLSSSDVVVDVLPLSFGYGFHQLLKVFLVGGTLVLERSFAYPADTLRRIESEGVTGFPGMPTVFALLLQHDLTGYDLSRIRYLTSMGAPLAPTLIAGIHAAFPNAQIFSMYSQTEACNALGLDPRELERRPQSVGKPLTGTEAWLVDAENRPVPAGDIGELVVTGGHVRSGYWNDADLSARRFRPGRIAGETLCYTGDLFRVDDAGFFYFIGRMDEVIKSGGRKVAPRLVEDVLCAIPGVSEAAVIGVPDSTFGHVLHAFIVLKEDARPVLTEIDILRHCSGVLEPFMLPRHIEIRTSLPRTSSGKISKSGLAGSTSIPVRSGVSAN